MKMKMKNMKLLVKLMEYVSDLEKGQHLFNMCSFQSGDGIHHTKKELMESCGTTACIAGWVYLCPAFKRQGLVPNAQGRPQFIDMHVTPTLKKLFGLTDSQMTSIFYDYTMYTPEAAVERIKEVIAGKYLAYSDWRLF